MLNNRMKENSNELNDFMNNSAVTKGIGDATRTVPSVVKIFASTIGGVSYGCLDNRECDLLNNNSCTPVEIFKLSRYVFPNKDPDPTIAGET